MQRAKKVGGVLLVVVVLGAMIGVLPAKAAPITGYIEFSGAIDLWGWTYTGKTTIGGNVTPTTMPNEMYDPAKVRMFSADGTLTAEYRNYRPVEYLALNTWYNQAADDRLISFNLSVMGAPSFILQAWGQQVGATGVVGPVGYPDYDNVGPTWFSQTNMGGVPTWWCEAQQYGQIKSHNLFDPNRFFDFVVLNFDDSAINPDGTLSLWIGGFVTLDLAGLEAGTAPHQVLEGRVRKPVWRDDDGDGYFVGPNAPGGTDCCDTPNAPCFARGMGVDTYLQDPPICDTCVCGVAACAPCARCIHPGAPEFAGDNIDSNCDGNDAPGCFIATASFGTAMAGKVVALQGLRDRHLLGNDLGRRVVDVYYRYSPAVASYIEGRPVLKTAVRTALLPVVGASWAMSHRGALAGLALGMVALGLVLRRKERRGKMMVLVLAAGFLAFSPLSADADVRADMDAVIAQSESCTEAVESLLEAGYPEAEAIEAVLAGCRDGLADVIASAIRSGADPFTVAYAAKAAGVDLREVVSALEGGTGEAAAAEQEPAGFRPPSPPVGISSVPATVIQSTWGQSHYVASPSL